MKIPIKKIGALCRHCNTPVIKKESKFNKKKLTKKYYYNAYLKCPKCGAMYMQEKWKINNVNVVKKKKTKKIKRIKGKKFFIPTRWCKESYAKYLKSKHWKRRSKEYLRSNPNCFICNEEANQTHHCSYKRIGREKKEDLIAMCPICHEETHNLILNDKQIKLKNAHEIMKTLKSLEI